MGWVQKDFEQVGVAAGPAAILRWATARTTLHKYTQADKDELPAAPNLMLDAIYKAEPRAVQ